VSENTNNEIKAQSWNECIVPNLDAVAQWLAHPQWNEMVARYLKTVEERFIAELISSKDRTREQERFLAGEIAMLREIIALPHAVRNSIKQKETAKKQESSRDPKTGY
jgi:hypothetical protein